MARRVSLPHADDLFRPTADKPLDKGDEAEPNDAAANGASAGTSNGRRRSSGRVRHDEKMTVYITSEELLDLEHARLSLRRTHGLAVDRGRLVREAVSLVLADLEANGDDSALVQRLRHG
ncbi:hypothetical protein [Nocardioides sp. CER19]|uniref:hypothetical protein n=1 Tax=Nocardioides sp. CER19 TaxID=3038538 RepID=UPI00244BD897|nr:hypothetical protein [Nocardioides sp. CER19]MDH2415580.1 hypothetical protein [Nocardioides sp. CER19]